VALRRVPDADETFVVKSPADDQPLLQSETNSFADEEPGWYSETGTDSARILVGSEQRERTSVNKLQGSFELKAVSSH